MFEETLLFLYEMTKNSHIHFYLQNKTWTHELIVVKTLHGWFYILSKYFAICISGKNKFTF